MTIGVWDDDAVWRERAEAALYGCAKRKKIDINVQKFDGGAGILGGGVQRGRRCSF